MEEAHSKCSLFCKVHMRHWWEGNILVNIIAREMNCLRSAVSLVLIFKWKIKLRCEDTLLGMPVLYRVDKIWLVVSEFKVTVSFLLTPAPYMLFHHPHFQFVVKKKKAWCCVSRLVLCYYTLFLTPSQFSKDLSPAECINIDPGPFFMRNNKLLIQI